MNSVVTSFWKRLRDSDISRVVLFVLAWRVIVLGGMLYVYHKLPLANVQPMDLSMLLKPTVQYDGGLYYLIAQHGYPASVVSCLDAFFPLYPFMLRFGTVLGIGYEGAAFVINLIATAIASSYLWLMAKDYFDSKERAWRTLLVFLLFPTAVFMAVMYTEALFCAVVFAYLYYLSRRRWLAAGLWAAVATAVRGPGIVVAVVGVLYFLWLWWNEKPRKFEVSGLWLLLAPVGLLATMLYHQVHSGDGLIFLKVYDICWTYRKLNPEFPVTIYHWMRDAVSSLMHHEVVGGTENLFMMVPWLVALATPFLLKKKRFLYGGFAVLTALFLSLFTTSESLNRYMLPVFPLYLLIVQWLDSEKKFYGWLVFSGMWFGIWLTVLSTGHWAG